MQDFTRLIMTIIIVGVIIQIVSVIGFFVSENRRAAQQQRSRRIHEFAAKLDAEGRQECKLNCHAGSHPDINEQQIEYDYNPLPRNQYINSTYTLINSNESTATENQVIERNMQELQAQQEDFRLASTGYEFGGYNSDLALNPCTEHVIEEMHSPSIADYDDAGWNDSFSDTGWDNNNFDTGFDSSGFDAFNSF